MRYLLFLLLANVSQAQIWEVFNTANSSIPYDNVYCVAVDSQNNKWVGTEYGLGKFDGANWTIYRTDNSLLTDNSIRALAVDKFGDIWIGTFSHGVVKHSPNSNQWVFYNQSNSQIVADNIRRITFDTSGTVVWIATSGGLSRFDGMGWTNFTTNSHPILSNNFQALAIKPSDNSLWAGTVNGGIIKVLGNQTTTYWNQNSPISDNTVTGLSFDKYGTLWMASPVGGVNQLSNTGAWNRVFTVNSNIATNSHFSLLAVGDTVFVGSQDQGLLHNIGSSWVSYNTANSPMPQNSVYNMAKDRHGLLWLATPAMGLVSVKPWLLSSIEEEEGLRHRVFPNPSADFIRLEIGEGTSNVEIVDIWGRRLFEQNGYLNKEAIEIGFLPVGLYNIIINKGGKTISSNFMKE